MEKSWIEEQEKILKEKTIAEIEFLLAVSHYYWMYRATGNEDYLKQKDEYMKKKLQ